MLEFLLEKKPLEQWDAVSLQCSTSRLVNPEIRQTLTMYLQSRPHKQEIRLIKEMMLESLKQSNPLIAIDPQRPAETLRKTLSMVSLLTDGSEVHDVQLAYFAKVIESNQQKAEGQQAQEDDDSSESGRSYNLTEEEQIFINMA